MMPPLPRLRKRRVKRAGYSMRKKAHSRDVFPIGQGEVRLKEEHLANVAQPNEATLTRWMCWSFLPHLENP